MLQTWSVFKQSVSQCVRVHIEVVPTQLAREKGHIQVQNEKKIPQRFDVITMWSWQTYRCPLIIGSPKTHVNTRIRLLPCLCNSCPLGQVLLIRPIRMLVYSLQLPNQRRWCNQWSGWILTGIWNEHQPQGSMCLRLCVFVCGSVRGWRGSTFARTATLSAWALMDHFRETMGGGGTEGVLIRGRRSAKATTSHLTKVRVQSFWG